MKRPHIFNSSEDQDPLVVTGKPIYQMADALPLVLWDCHYDESDVRWSSDVTADAQLDASVSSKKAASVNGLYSQLRSIRERSWLHSTLHDHFLQAASQFHQPPLQYLPTSASSELARFRDGTVIGIPLGGGTVRNTRYTGGKGYVKILDRKRLDDMEVIWERYKHGKGAKKEKKKSDDIPEVQATNEC